MDDTEDMEFSEILKETTRGMRELLLKKVEKQDKGKNFEAYLNYAKDNYSSRVNAVDLLSLESGLLENLQRVQESLANQWSAEDTRTAREVLEHGE